MEEYRFDGFRFDGVTSMLYHHHGIGKPGVRLIHKIITKCKIMTTIQSRKKKEKKLLSCLMYVRICRNEDAVASWDLEISLPNPSI